MQKTTLSGYWHLTEEVIIHLRSQSAEKKKTRSSEQLLLLVPVVAASANRHTNILCDKSLGSSRKNLMSFSDV